MYLIRHSSFDIQPLFLRYLDPLYGQLEITPQQLRLFQTEALTRLRDISLSAVPPLATPMGMITSRFEHSVGVGYLAQLLIKNPEFSDLGVNLYLAGILHDTGSPPFSHISEVFLEELTGQNHEEFVSTVLDQPDLNRAILDFGGERSIIEKLITGDLQPWSDLVNGTIDLDNIDNSLRWSLGAGVLQNKIYDPEDLIKAFQVHNGQLGLKIEYYSEIQKWELCRRLTYDLVYSDANLAAETMLVRALQFAYEAQELTEAFFKLTDSQALYVLEHRCNPKTQQLITHMRHWRFYQVVASMVQTGEVSETIRAYCQRWRERLKIADMISDSLSIPREAVTVHTSKDKGFKKIHLPFWGEKQQEEHQPLQRLNWRVKVYLHPDYKDLAEAVQELLDNSIIV